jgi:hypothetical protein
MDLSCPSPVFDGIDFTPCFRERCVCRSPACILPGASAADPNDRPLRRRASFRISLPTASYLTFLLPIVLAGSSLAIVLLARLIELSSPARRIELPSAAAAAPTASTGYVSPVGLEDAVLRSQARKVFGSEPEEGKSAFERVRDVGEVLLLAGLLALEVVRAVRAPAGVTAPWGGVALSAYLLALSVLTAVERIGTGLLGLHTNELEAHRTTLLVFYGALSFIGLRSAILDSAPTLLTDSLAAGITLVLLLLDIFTPYRAVLDGALAGHRARGAAFQLARAARNAEAGDSPDDGARKQTVPCLEEPRSLFARATFTYMNPLIFRHFNRPITKEETPDLREDDRTAVVVAGWRAYREARLGEEERAKPYAKGSLSWQLIWYFKGYFALQAVRSRRLTTRPSELGSSADARPPSPDLVGVLCPLFLRRAMDAQDDSRVHQEPKAVARRARRLPAAADASCRRIHPRRPCFPGEASAERLPATCLSE